MINWKYALLAMALSLLLACSSTVADQGKTLQQGSGELACTYPQQTASAAYTGAIDCNCNAEYFNAKLQLLGKLSMICSGNERSISSNSIPDHAPGNFPNSGNPHSIAAVDYQMRMTLSPMSGQRQDAREPAVARNGVKFEPETAESYNNQGEWRYEAVQDAINLGLDEHMAHVQPTGMYHYHGMPSGHMQLSGRGQSMTLVGWARDGFPLYARYGYSKPMDASSAIRVMQPSYQLKASDDASLATRPGLNASDPARRMVSSLPLGTFVQDWQYVAGSGDLDECNGRFGVTPEFPEGIYHYYLTDAYPYLQRCTMGAVAPEAKHRGPAQDLRSRDRRRPPPRRR